MKNPKNREKGKKRKGAGVGERPSVERSSGSSTNEPQFSTPESQSAVRNPQPAVTSRSRIGVGWTISIALTAALGLAISIYLTIHHYHIMSGLPEFQSFCSVSEYIDCDMVNSSTYSEFMGLPVALFGAGVYASIICLIILGIFARGVVLNRYISVIALLGLLSFGLSIYLAVVSVFVLHAICIFCVITYFINLFMMVGGGMAVCRMRGGRFRPVDAVIIAPFSHAAQNEPTALGNALGVFAVVMVVIQGFFAAIYLDTKYLGFTEKDIASFKEQYMALKPMDIDLEASPYWGSADPDLTIVVFEDYLCNFCRRSHVNAFPVFKEFKDRIKVVFKYLPYDKECNSSLKKTLHPGACRSSVAAACASLQGEFTRFQEYFFDHQDVIKPDMDILGVVADIGGVDMDDFKTCLTQGRGEWLVRRDFKEAMKLKVKRTPAYFFNGRKWEGALKPLFIKKILEWELNPPNAPAP